jgi:hypothetical protein
LYSDTLRRLDKWQTYFGAFIGGLLLRLYKAFALMYLWTWFVAPIFHISDITYLEALGLLLVIAICGSPVDTNANQQSSRVIITVLDFCIPDEKMDGVKRAMEEMSNGVWLQLALMFFDDAVATSLLLVLGWGIHVWIS